MTKPKTQSKKNSKKRKFPEPGKESREVFLAALSIAKDLLKSESLNINLDEKGDVTLGVDSDKLEAIPKDRFTEELTSDHFLTLVRTEFGSLVEAATYSDSTRGVQSEIPSEILNEVGLDEFLWRLKQLEEKLLPADLRERATLRRTSKGLVLKNLTWEIAIKKHDQVAGKLLDIPYGALTITFASPQTTMAPLRFGSKGTFMELPTYREPKQLTLELHQVDVVDMIKALTELRDNLEKIKTSK